MCELGVDVGLREPAFELGALLLEHAGVGFDLIVSLFSALCTVDGAED